MMYHHHYYYGSTFDLKSGELVSIAKLTDIDGEGLENIIEDVLGKDEIYAEVREDNYEIHYYQNKIAMDYEYYYDGESFYIILNRTEKGESRIVKWNGKWEDDYAIAVFAYGEQPEGELLQTEK